MVQDQLIRVNERIGNCPASDTKKLGELNAIRSDLVSMLGKGVGQEINVANSGLTGIGKGIALEGVCAVLLLIPAPQEHELNNPENYVEQNPIARQIFVAGMILFIGSINIALYFGVGRATGLDKTPDIGYQALRIAGLLSITLGVYMLIVAISSLVAGYFPSPSVAVLSRTKQRDGISNYVACIFLILGAVSLIAVPLSAYWLIEESYQVNKKTRELIEKRY